MKMQEIEPQLRPREKALRHGIAALSDRELLAVLLQSGTKGKSALELADEVLFRCGSLAKLMQMQPKDLMDITGIKEVRAMQLFAGIELSKRIAETSVQQEAVHTPADLVSWLQLRYGHEQQEHFIVVFLDVHNHILHHRTLFLGTLNASMVHPREIYKEALRCSACSIICAHNHPGGEVMPSQADLHVTKQIVQSGEIVGIPLLDHLIIGRDSWFSFRQRDLL